MSEESIIFDRIERELRWIDDILDLEHVPREEYSAQGGGICRLTRAGRIHWLAERRRDAERLLDQDQAACLAERDRWQRARAACEVTSE